MSIIKKEERELLNFLQNLWDKTILSPWLEVEICIKTEELTAELLGDYLGSDRWRESGHRFVQFASVPDGSVYCLWTHPGCADRPAVAFLGSEGVAIVVADCLEEYIRQLSSGSMFSIFSLRWNPIPDDGGLVKNGTWEERTAIGFDRHLDIGRNVPFDFRANGIRVFSIQIEPYFPG